MSTVRRMASTKQRISRDSKELERIKDLETKLETAVKERKWKKVADIATKLYEVEENGKSARWSTSMEPTKSFEEADPSPTRSYNEDDPEMATTIPYTRKDEMAETLAYDYKKTAEIEPTVAYEADEDEKDIEPTQAYAEDDEKRKEFAPTVSYGEDTEKEREYAATIPCKDADAKEIQATVAYEEENLEESSKSPKRKPPQPSSRRMFKRQRQSSPVIKDVKIEVVRLFSEIKDCRYKRTIRN